MSDPRLDAIAEAARNRGLKLVRSRVRTPGKRRFGKVGLTDLAGREVLGMDAKGPTAKPEDVEAYLRSLGEQDWGASLHVAAPHRKRTDRAPPGRNPASDSAPPRNQPAKTARKLKPAPKPVVRAAQPADAAPLVTLIKLLGHEVDVPGVRRRLAALKGQGMPQPVATIGKDVVGLVGLHAMTAVHRDEPVGRVTILVVAEQARGKGIGRLLLETAERQLKGLGCGLVEITSNDRLTAAHAFYRHMGYERTSIRFCKSL